MWQTVVSLIGVILIARPASLFGGLTNTPLEPLKLEEGEFSLTDGPKVVTPSERMFAVG